ncbi:MAG: glycosyltransferase family 1 protein, partial [Patescibacteria group bacterium]|nr:glycosyltransferase family 1 protein [Patescibacteria group bacterium]
MKIAININELTLRQNTGVKVYTREIAKALGKIDRENEYYLHTSRRDGDLSRLDLSRLDLSRLDLSRLCDESAINRRLRGNFKNFKLKPSKSRLPFWTYLKLPQEIKRDQPDVLFMPIQATPFFKKPKNVKLVVTVHDLAFLLFPNHFTQKDKFLLNFHTKRAVKMADKIIAPSEATKKDLVKFYGISENKIKVIWHGVIKSELGSKASEPSSDLILFVGSIQPRKNIVGLIEAFELLRQDPPSPLCKRRNNLKLVICGGRGWMADETYKKAKESKFSREIIFTGSVSDKERDELYKNASVFALPSFYEGFGLPVLEAMSYGVPCVVGDNSSLSEIVGDSALLVDANNPNDIAKKISSLLSNSELRKDFSQRGLKNAEKFTWKKTAEKMLEVFE